MKSISSFACLAAVSVVCLSVSCTAKPDAAGPEGAGSGGTSGSSVGQPGDGTGGSSTAGTGTGGATSGGACAGVSTGVLFAGDPLYNDKTEVPGPNPAGQGLLADPPIRNEAMAIIGTRLFVETEQEIWSTDMSAAAPTISRVAGLEDGGFISAGVACKDTRFLVLRDMTKTADGKLVVVDYVGGAVIEISDPGGPNCQSHWVAGTHMMTADPGSDFPLAQGDRDGAGSQALFGDVGGGGGINKVTVDPAGNIYTYDDGTGKFKKIAADADRAVSTIGVGAIDDNVMGLAFLNGKLYATGVDGTNDFLEEIDPATYSAATPKGNVHTVFRNRDHFAEISSGSQAVLAQVISDGEALIVSGQSGYVWRVATDGTVRATLAGTGPFLDYEGGFNPLVSHPGNAWQLVSSLSNRFGGPWLALGGGKLYWSGGIEVGKYILQFACR